MFKYQPIRIINSDGTTSEQNVFQRNPCSAGACVLGVNLSKKPEYKWILVQELHNASTAEHNAFSDTTENDYLNSNNNNIYNEDEQQQQQQQKSKDPTQYNADTEDYETKHALYCLQEHNLFYSEDPPPNSQSMLEYVLKSCSKVIIRPNHARQLLILQKLLEQIIKLSNKNEKVVTQLVLVEMSSPSCSVNDINAMISNDNITTPTIKVLNMQYNESNQQLYRQELKQKFNQSLVCNLIVPYIFNLPSSSSSSHRSSNSNSNYGVMGSYNIQ